MTESITEKDAQEARKAGCGCWWVLLVLAGLPLIMLAVAALFFIVRERSASQELLGRLNERTANALPVDNASLAEFHESLTSDADAASWQAAIRALETPQFNESTSGVPLFDSNALSLVMLPPLGVPWPEQATVEDFLTKWSEVREQLLQLSWKQLQPDESPVRFDIQFNSVLTELDHLATLRMAARLLRLDGELAVRSGDSGRLSDDIRGLLGLSNALRGEPTLVSQLVRIAIDSMAVDLLRHSIEFDALDKRELEILLPLFRARTKIGKEWGIAIHGELASALPVYKDPSLGSNQGMPRLPGRSRDALALLNYMDDALAMPTQDLTEFNQACTDTAAAMETMVTDGPLAMFDTYLTSLLAPSIAAVGKAFLRDTALHRQAVLGIAIRLYEDRTGELPTTLEELKLVDVDPQQIPPPMAQQHGYSVDNEGAVLWGFDTVFANAMPYTPPPRPAPEAEESEIEKHQQWTWYLPRTEP